MVWKGPVIAREIVSTALYVHKWAGQVKGCNLGFCMLASEHRRGRHPLAGRVLRFTQGKPRGIPERTKEPLRCRKDFWSCVGIIHGRLLSSSTNSCLLPLTMFN